MPTSHQSAGAVRTAGPGPAGRLGSALVRRAAPTTVREVLNSPGVPLDGSTRALMEAHFGHSLSAVRIHDDEYSGRSARAVNAAAYTFGAHVVFGAGSFRPGSEEGRRLIAHELAHVLQQASPVPPPGQILVGRSDDPAEREAEAAARALTLPEVAPTGHERPPRHGAAPHPGSNTDTKLRRRLIVDPPAAFDQIEEDFHEICPREFPAVSPGPEGIQSHCSANQNTGCGCLCDVTADPNRDYTIQVLPATVSFSSQVLADGTTATVPTSSLWPNTKGGSNPVVKLASKGSSVEFGFFKADGRAEWYTSWRILEHELCGHGRLRQTYGGGTGDRPQHDVTIDTENTIAGEHGQPARGHFADRRQGEAFYNPTGNRSRVAFYQTDGLHYEVP